MNRNDVKSYDAQQHTHEFDPQSRCASHFCHKPAAHLDKHGFPVCRHHLKLDKVVELVHNAPLRHTEKLRLVKDFDRSVISSLSELERRIDALLTRYEPPQG